MSSVLRHATAAVRPGAASAATEASTSNSTEGGVTLLEAALEAWADCQPDGGTLPESSVPSVLPAIAFRIPGSWQSPEASQMFTDLFTPQDDDVSLFQKMLRAHDGRVHFLYFWSAFSKAFRLLESMNGDGSVASLGKEEGLTLELETLRDSLLRMIEASGDASGEAEASTVTIATSQLVEALHSAAAMSSSSEFWLAAEKMLREGGSDRLTLEELAVLILSWLPGAIAEQHRLSTQSSLSRSSTLERETTETEQTPEPEADESLGNAACLPFIGRKPGGIPVFLHIYDVSQEDSVHRLNKWLASRYSPLKFGGVFHAGVEVNGLEWSYGMSLSDTMSGISCVEPKMHPAHRYRQTVQLRRTKLSAEEIAELLSELIEEYPGDDYEILRRNCCHFADDFCRRLGVGRIPGWVHRLARVGARLDGALQAVAGRSLLDASEDHYDD